MIPLSFEYLLKSLLKEYRSSKTLAFVPVYQNEKNVPLGIAAGPHTQMAQNIVACFAAGSAVIELKTVQIIDGENLKLEKPCIYTGFEVFNTEWSTELTVQQACKEYIKAYILIRLLGMEFSLVNALNVTFLPSIGYDLKGIKSEK
nr:putative selenate reductase subunit YgfK [Treponema sp.]